MFLKISLVQLKDFLLTLVQNLIICIENENFKDFTMKMVKMNLFYERLPSNIILIENINFFFFFVGCEYIYNLSN